MFKVPKRIRQAVSSDRFHTDKFWKPDEQALLNVIASSTTGEKWEVTTTQFPRAPGYARCVVCGTAGRKEHFVRHASAMTDDSHSVGIIVQMLWQFGKAYFPLANQRIWMKQATGYDRLPISTLQLFLNPPTFWTVAPANTPIEEYLDFLKKTTGQKPENVDFCVKIDNPLTSPANKLGEELLKQLIVENTPWIRLDTGSDITLLNVDTWKQMGEPELENSNVTVRDASGGTMQIQGVFECNFQTGKSTGKGYAYVTPRSSLMGLEWINQCDSMAYHLNMMTVATVEKDCSTLVDNLKAKYATVFEEGLGRCTKELADMKVIPGSKPVYRQKRPLPHSAVEIVEKELNRLIDMDVIEPVTHSKWAAPIVCVKKANGKIRVCADFSTGLNEVLENHEYPLPIPDDIFATLNGGKWFSQIDFSDAYLQVELTDNAKELIVINTHRGLYR